MRVVYSNEKIEGLDGVYKNPRFFDGKKDPFATEVFTDDETIAEVYKDSNVKVFRFDGKPFFKVKRKRQTKQDEGVENGS